MKDIVVDLSILFKRIHRMKHGKPITTSFSKVIDRAMIACENSGHSVPDDFAEVSKIVEAGAVSKHF